MEKKKKEECVRHPMIFEFLGSMLLLSLVSNDVGNVLKNNPTNRKRDKEIISHVSNDLSNVDDCNKFILIN